MKTTIYWALQHTYCAVHEFRFIPPAGGSIDKWSSSNGGFGWRPRCLPPNPVLHRHPSDKEISMSCTRCSGICVNDQFYDRGDEQGQLHLGAWRWVSRCPLCGTMVYERAESRVVDVICPQVKTVIIRRYPESSPVTKPRSNVPTHGRRRTT